MNFSNLFGGGSGIGMTDIMKIVAQFAGGDVKTVVPSLVKQFATPENIKSTTAAIIAGIAEWQTKAGLKPVLYAESTADGTDILFRVFNRVPEPRALEPLGEIYLSQITQEHLLFIISLLFNGTETTGTKLIG